MCSPCGQSTSKMVVKPETKPKMDSHAKPYATTAVKPKK